MIDHSVQTDYISLFENENPSYFNQFPKIE